MNDSTDIERLNPTRFHPAEPATSMRGRFNLWTQLVSGFLNRSIREGTLTLRFPDGAVRQFGKGDPEVAATITKRSTVRRIALNPDLAVGEAYMDGSLCIDRGDIYDFLDLVLRNLGDPTGSPLRRIWLAFRRIIRPLTLFNPTKRAAQNVSHHYDLTDELYASFLDSDRQYSCAYFAVPDDSLEDAQIRKKRHIAAKLLLQPGQRVLDIGSGWGGMARFLAHAHDVSVTGLTLSKEQLEYARRETADAGLEDQVDFHLRDYRHETARFDRIVSVGMFEHVGPPHYEAYFDTLTRRLTEDGVALVHTIGNSGPPGAPGAWIKKYIFPGGYVPSMSEVLPAIEKSGLIVTDVEVLRLHYAETLREWRHRFLASRVRLAEHHDDRFWRMWEFYLAVCETAFRHTGLVVFQFQLAKRKATVPLTRDYIAEAEGRS